MLAEAKLKKIEVAFWLTSEEESETFGLKAKQVGWSKANATCRCVKERKFEKSKAIYTSQRREASRQVP